MYAKANVGAGFGTEQMFVLQSINKQVMYTNKQPLAGDKWKFSPMFEMPSARLFFCFKVLFFMKPHILVIFDTVKCFTSQYIFFLFLNFPTWCFRI